MAGRGQHGVVTLIFTKWEPVIVLIDTRTLGLLASDGVLTVVFPEIDSHEVSIIAGTKLCYHADEAI